MLKLFNGKKNSPLKYPVFNLEITRDRATPLLRECDETSQYIGEFVVYNSGKLNRGRNNSLHTYEAKLEYCKTHIHFSMGGITHIIDKNQKPFLKAEFEDSRFTLNGLYSSVKSWKLEKPQILIDHIKKFNPEFQFNSIAIHENTRVKLLENAYKKYVSNQ